jgi:hypothetical protein
MNINQLSNNKLIEEYKNIKSKFVKANPKDKEITRIYGLIIGEIRKRSFKTFGILGE